MRREKGEVGNKTGSELVGNMLGGKRGVGGYKGKKENGWVNGEGRDRSEYKRRKRGKEKGEGMIKMMIERMIEMRIERMIEGMMSG